MSTFDIATILSVGLTLSVVGGFFFRFVGSIAAKRDPSSALSKACAFMVALCNDVAGAAVSASQGKSVLSPQVVGDRDTLVTIAQGAYRTYWLMSDGIARDGSPLPVWEDLPVMKQEAYIAAAAKARVPS